MISAKSMSDKVRTMALATIRREYPAEYAEQRKRLLREGVNSKNAAHHAAVAVARNHPSHWEAYKADARRILYQRHNYTPAPQGNRDKPRGWQASKTKQWDGPPNKGKFFNHATGKWETEDAESTSNPA
ncbi:hypothetical protein [Cellulosimicrobium phage DS1]|nr:hypothetical protein [Cellulosimicrobium phage DS1]